MDPFKTVASNIFTLYCIGVSERRECGTVDAAENEEGNSRNMFTISFFFP